MNNDNLHFLRMKANNSNGGAQEPMEVSRNSTKRIVQEDSGLYNNEWAKPINVKEIVLGASTDQIFSLERKEWKTHQVRTELNVDQIPFFRRE
jgi:hypothetical protein